MQSVDSPDGSDCLPSLCEGSLVSSHDRFSIPFLQTAPWRLSGTVIVALLNHRSLWRDMGEAMARSPYKAPPRAPVLAVMPHHTQIATGTPIALPALSQAGSDPNVAAQGAVEVGVALGIVIGRPVSRADVAEALESVAGYLALGEFSLPVPAGSPAHYRPGARWRARDGFCPLSSKIVPASAVADPDALTTRVDIDGQMVQEDHTGNRVRDVARLVADVSEFMTLRPGDVLSLGRSHPAPLARAGQRIRLTIDGVGTLEHLLVHEVAPRSGGTS